MNKINKGSELKVPSIARRTKAEQRSVYVNT